MWTWSRCQRQRPLSSSLLRSSPYINEPCIVLAYLQYKKNTKKRNHAYTQKKKNERK